jgi:hypothetical protein
VSKDGFVFDFILAAGVSDRARANRAEEFPATGAVDLDDEVRRNLQTMLLELCRHFSK